MTGISTFNSNFVPSFSPGFRLTSTAGKWWPERLRGEAFACKVGSRKIRGGFAFLFLSGDNPMNFPWCKYRNPFQMIIAATHTPYGSKHCLRRYLTLRYCWIHRDRIDKTLQSLSELHLDRGQCRCSMNPNPQSAIRISGKMNMEIPRKSAGLIQSWPFISYKLLMIVASSLWRPKHSYVNKL